MTHRRRSRSVALAALGIAVAGVASCSDSSTESATTTTIPRSTSSTTTVAEPSTTSAPPAPTSTPAPAPTTVIAYRPYDDAGVLTEPVLQAQAGSCSGAAFSASTDRRDAYRCSTDTGMILDPCFAASGAESVQVACLDTRPGNGVVVLELTTTLPDRAPPTVGVVAPIIFVLGDGTACTLLGGTARIVDGIRMDYGCGSAATGLTLVGGALETSTATWTFRTTDPDATRPLATTPVATAYV